MAQMLFFQRMASAAGPARFALPYRMQDSGPDPISRIHSRYATPDQLMNALNEFLFDLGK